MTGVHVQMLAGLGMWSLLLGMWEAMGLLCKASQPRAAAKEAQHGEFCLGSLKP